MTQRCGDHDGADEDRWSDQSHTRVRTADGHRSRAVGSGAWVGGHGHASLLVPVCACVCPCASLHIGAPVPRPLTGTVTLSLPSPEAPGAPGWICSVTVRLPSKAQSCGAWARPRVGPLPESACPSPGHRSPPPGHLFLLLSSATRLLSWALSCHWFLCPMQWVRTLSVLRAMEEVYTEQV